MGVPIELISPGIYSLSFLEEGVNIRAERVDRDRHNKVHGTLTFSVAGDRLLRAEVNFDSIVSKRAVQKALEERSSGTIDWYATIEKATMVLDDLKRQGNPAEYIDDTTEWDDTLSWHLTNFVLENEASVIYGDGDTGKSLIACLIAVLIGGNPQHTDLPFVSKQGRVLYCDYESTKKEIAGRVAKISAGLDMPIPRMEYRKMEGPFIDDVEALQALIHHPEFPIDVVIIDSMGPALWGNDLESGPVNAFFNALRSLSVSCFIIDHTTKEGQKQYGSVYKYHRARLRLHAKASEESRVDGIAKVAIYPDKLNNGIRPVPFGLSFAFGTGVITTQSFSLSDDIDFGKSQSIKDRIHVHLRDHANKSKATVPELVTALGEAHASILRALNRNQVGTKERNAKEIFRKLDRETWALNYVSGAESGPVQREVEQILREEDLDF